MPTLEALSRYRFTGKSERAVREEWIRPLLEHLGYGIDTLNDVLFEERLTLRNPRRKIGSETRMVDYTPTVMGHGLWIIEAKAPDPHVSWEDAISQAWLYATHPDVDVPFLVVADGSRIAVYEVIRNDWDKPVLDIAATSLRSEFGRLVEVLGAAHVAATIRERQLRHLASAMRAELDPARLDETVARVQLIARESMPSVVDNRRRVLQDRFAKEKEGRDELARAAGVWGIAQMYNQPLPMNFQDVARAVSVIKDLPEGLRSREIDQFVEAARLPIREFDQQGQPPARMFWMLRLAALKSYLHLLDDPGCGSRAAELARAAFHDHLLDFPDDPVARAAHRLERVLPPFVLRITLSVDEVDLPEAARRATSTMSDESLLRQGVDADELLLRAVTLSCRKAFSTLEWTVGELDAAAAPLERVVDRIEYRRDRGQGQAADPFMEDYLRRDYLVDHSATLAAQHRDLLDEDAAAALDARTSAD